MKQILLLLTGLFFLLPVIRSQHLIGLKKQLIEKEVKVLYPTFTIDNSFVNNTYKYLKYVDKINDQTVFLIFLSDDDVCTSTKMFCDYSLLDQVKTDLQKYKPTGKDEWTYTIDGVEYSIKLKREEWYFSLFTSKKQ